MILEIVAVSILIACVGWAAWVWSAVWSVSDEPTKDKD